MQVLTFIYLNHNNLWWYIGRKKPHCLEGISGKCKLNFYKEMKLIIICSVRKLLFQLFLRQMMEEKNTWLWFTCLRHYFFHTSIVWNCSSASISNWGFLLTGLTFRKLQLGKINLLLCQADIFGGGIPDIQDISAELFHSELGFLRTLKMAALSV